ncbi:hypothetical protein OG548_16740 [Streptomyces sp. NBC_01356]|uniref:hypothetical protein n=1 Tax=Streptomyces sp. NBC_01356 TaxID=2903836 RepID=UPI002E31850D|nr:hypothetical protein [Streptomyces sp. NBC_01356]
MAVATGSFLAGDALPRTHTALELAAKFWPWALLSLAALNLLRSVVSPGSLIGPGILGAVACTALAFSHGVTTHAMVNMVAPIALVLVGVGLLHSAFPKMDRGRWTSFLTTRRARAPVEVGARTAHPLLVARALAGELRVDLTGSCTHGEAIMHATALLGHIRLYVPRTWSVKVHTTGAVLTRVTETGPRLQTDPGIPAHVVLHVLGACGAVTIVRT